MGNKNTLTYPKVANFDDQIVGKENVLYDVFFFSQTFEHLEISEKNKRIEIQGHVFELKGPQLFYDENEWLGETIDKNIVVLPHEKLEITTTFLPKETITLAKESGATIHIDTASLAVLEPKLNSQDEIETYFLRMSSRGETTYWRKQRVESVDEEFKVGDQFIIGGISVERRPHQLKITGLTQELTLNTTELLATSFQAEYPMDFPEYRRSPRILRVPPSERVTINSPESVPEESKSEILRTVLPPLTMLGVSAVTSVLSHGNPLMMLGMGGASVLTTALTVSSYLTNKKETKQKLANREENYNLYLIRKQAELNKLEKEQRKALDHHFPTMETLAQMILDYNSRIYEKTTNNEDFLEFSLGLGSSPTSYDIEFGVDEQQDDELVKFAKDEVVEPRRLLKDAPIPTKLLGQTFGFAGSYPVLRTAISTLLFQIATFHSYRDVEFVSLVPEERYEKDWAYWRWLPHFQIRSLNLRGFIHHAQSRDMVLNSFYQLMNKRRQSVRDAGQDKPKFSPHYVLTILDDSYLAGHGLNEFLAEDMSQYGVTVIWGKEAPSMLPETVTTMVQYFSSEAAELVNENKVYVAKTFQPYHLPSNVPLATVIQRLANLHHVEVVKNAIPQAVTFLDMYNVKKVDELQVAERWAKANTAKTLSVPLGLRGRDDLVELNLHERAHGPHGLVAGTTGSGKSEIIQSYVLSLAINFAPEDVGFLPIDFKGGGMANEFKNLPHLLGSITNLDGASSARALASIRAELQKRQRMFAKFGVNHINGYTKLYKQGKEITDLEEKKKYPENPIPHLFLISDEFAELKANEPEFMVELVSTARIGRSLGVHLILATQKPSGVVDDQIWSNSRFKLALKVADESDSNEIIKTPDAASIVEPGRAYLQVGNNEIFELFQSAWSGATYDPNATVEEKVDDRVWLINDFGQYQLLSTDLSEEEERHQGNEEELPSQLKAVVNHIAELTEKMSSVLPEKPWLPPLEKTIVTPEISPESAWQGERNLAVPLALMDIPSKQAQESFIFDFEKFSHTAIYGSAGFGKSTILQTLVMNLARQNNPEQVQFNLLDFGTNGLLPLKDLPHVSDLARLEEEEKLIKFVKRIREEINHRKELFTEVGVASLSQYEAKTKQILPVVVTVVDSYDPMRESPLEEGVDSVLNQLLREGASVGMYLILTGIRVDTFKISMTSNIPTRMSLFLVEENAIKDVVGREALIPQEIVGRGQLKLDTPLAVQFYLATKGETDLYRLTALEEEVRTMNSKWAGKRPLPIPMVPKTLTMQDFFESVEVQNYLSEGNLPLGLSLETTEVVGFRPKKDGYFLIVDNEPSQTEYLERTILENFKLLEGKYQRIVFDAQDRFVKETTAFDIVVGSTEFPTFTTEIISEFEGRLALNDPSSKPMLIYIPETLAFSEKSFITEDKLRKLLREGYQVGIHLLFQGEKSKVDNSFNEIIKTLRANVPTGLVGSRLSEQSYVKVKTNYSEPMMEHDQDNYFVGRFAGRMKLVSEE